MQPKDDRGLTRREMIQRSGVAAGALLLAHPADALENDAPLPNGVKAVWDRKQAYAEKTPTRERICLNGLWRWQPTRDVADSVPAGRWGYFKVPGSWPGITDYMQKDCQTVYAHSDWKQENLGGATAAWYQREITVPTDWAGRRIAVSAEYLNSLATVYVDGKRVGDIRFPGGELDLTAVCRPGVTHLLSLLVTSLPLQAVMLSYTDTNAARQKTATVERRGLCGDVYLVGVPKAARIANVDVATSVRRGEITFDAALEGLAPAASYTLHVEIRDTDHVVKEFSGSSFRSDDLKGGRLSLTQKWKPEKLWDLPTPGNLYTAHLSLREGSKLHDEAHPIRFGFREFWIQGRDFYLNGTRIYLTVVPFDNAQVGAAWASYAGAKETFERLKAMGINFVYTHNYGCEPGAHLSFAEILRAADDTGMLVALSQPHFSHYDWKAPDTDRNNGYARHAEFYVRVAQNHPSVVAYSMSHNATGTIEDMNPDMIDGLPGNRPSYAQRNDQLALRAQAIVERFDPNRIVYHHSSGNLGTMHTINFYVNFTPRQELSDWFEHWATRGVKPLLLCEYSAPSSWDWTMYRGWYQGKREWGSAVVPWEYCLAEWNAHFLGDRAYRISDREKANLRWEAAQFRAGKLWHRWDYPTVVGSSAFVEQHPIFADYITDNWRAYRTWGVSAINPWEHYMFWQLRPGVDRGRKALPVDWDHLQRPGFSADYLEDRMEDHLVAYDRADWIPNAAGQALLRNNQPLLAYIGGKAERFTSKDHNFLPGETVEKQLILRNNSRASVTCEADVSVNLVPASGNAKGKPSPPADGKSIKQLFLPNIHYPVHGPLHTGNRILIPLLFPIGADYLPGRYELKATFRFSTGETQSDTFAVNVLPPHPALKTSAKIALFDPKGDTAQLLTKLKVAYKSIDASTDLSFYDLLIVGKGALTREGAAPDIRRVRQGLKVIVMEQTAEVLERRFGFRVAEYGMRQVFPRISNHPLLAGLTEENLRDWRGEATLLPPRLKYTIGPRYAPMVKWCDIDVTRVWRCGCRGNVASVLIEKPARGDFMPIVDGGYSLQYSPLLEYREGRGMVLFCQMDITARTESDPTADRLARNILQYASTWKPAPARQALYVGDPAGKAHLEATGFTLGNFPNAQRLTPNTVLIVGSGGGQQLAAQQAAVRDWLKAGGRLLALGLDEADANAFLPFTMHMKTQEHIATYFDLPEAGSWRAGVAPADVHNRDPRELPLIAEGADILGNGILAKARNADVIFNQFVPWQFDPKKSMNLKRTFRRAACLTTRLAANTGVPCSTPLLDRFHNPLESAGKEQRWLNGFYLDTPEEWDDPYRFFGW